MFLSVCVRTLCLDKLGAEKYIDFTKEEDIPSKVKEITTYGAHGTIVFAANKASYAIGPNVVSVLSIIFRCASHANHMDESFGRVGPWCA